jgi:hypothetical protein
MHESSNQPQSSGSANVMGGQGTGGGVTTVSTPDQVNAAIDKALELATGPDLKKNIFVQFWKARGPTSKSNYIGRPIHVFPNFASTDENVRFESPFYEALKKNKIVRLSQGDCPHPSDEATADASVSEHSYNATICFSIGNLTHVSPFSLLRETLSLVLHEVTHLGGADEPEARVWQDEFADYFGGRFGNVLSDTITTPTITGIAKAYGLLGRAQAFARRDANDRHILPDITAAAEEIGHLPNANDELALMLKINPPHPELIQAYVASVQDYIDWIGSHIEFHDDPTKLSFVSPMKVFNRIDDQANNLSPIDEAYRKLNHVNETFLEFTLQNYKRVPIPDEQSTSGPYQTQ